MNSFLFVYFTQDTFHMCSGTFIVSPNQYAIFISPIYDLEDMSSFADDNYTIRWSKDILNAKIKLENSLSVITSWFKASGLKVNESKTKICLFSRASHATNRDLIKWSDHNYKVNYQRPRYNI